MAKGFALVKGKTVEILIGATLKDARRVLDNRERKQPVMPGEIKIAHVTFDYLGMGKAENIKLSRFV